MLHDKKSTVSDIITARDVPLEIHAAADTRGSRGDRDKPERFLSDSIDNALTCSDGGHRSAVTAVNEKTKV